MVIVQLWGGLGNQMFQYALHLSYLQKNISSKLDTAHYKTDNGFNGYELESIFNVKGNYTYNPERLFVKLTGKLFHKIFNAPYRENNEIFGCYTPKVADLKFGFIKGYWQTEKYFKPIENIIRKKFVFPALNDQRNIDLLHQINTTNAVSVHIRRGDYLLNNRDWAMGFNYYQKAIDLIKEKIDDPYFFIFSDDINWAKENIQEKNIAFVDWNQKEQSYIDMQLMSNCKHNIIANSSFSWWGAWLNNNSSKIVIAPDQWLPIIKGTREIIPERWIKISF
ncbi:MAG: alpha-1,2-fucosyltransferase [Bacteroidota bacterium]